MKIIKISLAIAVIGLISFFVIKSLLGGSPEIKKVAPPVNPFTNSIEKEIINLSKLPENKFCKDKYNEVKYYIDDYFKSQLLGKNKFENNQWKEILSKNLYSVYTDKFIKQAYTVFNNKEWKLQDLSLIRSECITLRKSEFLEKGSPVDNSFLKIQQILRKYDEINNFIAISKYFPIPQTNLNSQFPFADLKAKISRIDTYKKNKLEDVYVNNCTRLHSELNTNKKRLIDTYLTYLDTKINKWTGKYKQFEFATFNEYQNIIYNPLKKELEDFKTNCNSNYTYDYNRYNNISNRLNSDRKDAYLNIL
ncbi:hypothetical protein [Flavobacterium gilvum]|uniref:Uncharacterized protein n=1 Tax=Flavobacterium gilvum TaxID=1492737 RepID=A0AAC9I7X2_9FLAO|nr:hypothetical protein [Flavobacterium gilvum]AOW11016.1 hypothetical protein EM308_16830 [Flavobacterium gilvum]KFC59189.1 hypothetical protein FEM08_20500 [Flavobacterium gilvum]